MLLPRCPVASFATFLARRVRTGLSTSTRLISLLVLIIPFSTLALLYPLPSHPLLFFSPPKDLSPDALTNWFGLFYILFFVADTFTSVPYYALGVELTDSYMERNSVYFWQNLFAGVGTLFGMVTPGALLSRFSLVIRLGCLSGRSPDLQVQACGSTFPVSQWYY